MYYKEQNIPEMYDLLHRNDDDDQYVDYEKIILTKSIAPYLYNNDMMSGFLNNLQPMVTKFFDNVNIIKNLKNYTVDKYYYFHKN